MVYALMFADKRTIDHPNLTGRISQSCRLNLIHAVDASASSRLHEINRIATDSRVSFSHSSDKIALLGQTSVVLRINEDAIPECGDMASLGMIVSLV